MGAATILYLVSEDWFFCSHRLPIARAARDAGYQVVVACRVDRHGGAITTEGFKLVPLAMQRGSAGAQDALRSIAAITSIYRRERPDLVHHVGVKPCLFGTLAAVIAGVPRIVNAFTGLGYLFTAETGKARLLRQLVLGALRPLLARPGVAVIVQNRDDLRLLVDLKVADPERTVLIRGSGVDPERFRPGPPPHGTPMVTYAGRMLADKGIGELVGAARRLRERGRPARVVLVGPSDAENPQAIKEERLRRWHAEGVVEWWGLREDMPAIWRQTTVAVLPSYREGLPKSLLEAAASGLPLIATDVPGCRELVRPGEDGLLVPARDAVALADAIGTLLADPALRARMGGNARQRVKEAFAEAVVAKETLALYRRLLVGEPDSR